jgi:hypothetical protein
MEKGAAFFIGFIYMYTEIRSKTRSRLPEDTASTEFGVFAPESLQAFFEVLPEYRLYLSVNNIHFNSPETQLEIGSTLVDQARDIRGKVLVFRRLVPDNTRHPSRSELVVDTRRPEGVGHLLDIEAQLNAYHQALKKKEEISLARIDLLRYLDSLVGVPR